ncbi:MAG TPA: carboxypeptidase-like regulatory domain-containing protein [Gaiellaceae bacterium]|nr:carboxypeptidase-like regulatory domain-containing protein [Gaiellaceae bacterium]
MKPRGLAMAGFAMAGFALALSASGSGSGGTAERVVGQSPLEMRESCVATDGETEIDVAEAAHPIAIGPRGPVTGLRRELDGTALYISDIGVCSVAETADGTWALTGIVVDEENDAPVVGATVSLDALEPPGLDVRLVTRTDDDGTFAFANVPIEGSRSCYLTLARAPGFLTFTSVDQVTPQTYAQSISLSRKGYFEGLGSDRSACVEYGPS